MPQFLVRLATSLPPEMPESDRAALLEMESARGAALVTEGTIQHIWRLPGQLANVGVWFASDVETLHEAICSLPAWRWMAVSVTSLAQHPLGSGR